MINSSPKIATLAQWLVYIEALHPKSIAMGLGRVRDVVSKLDLNPDFPIITIAGTNGKGSTCAMIEAMYLNAGYRVGAYTSPHFMRYNERIRVNQQTISDECLCTAFAAIEEARDDIQLTYFEMGTLAAIWHFAQSSLDVAILEVGMGGRLDAVNVFESVCAIVTSVDLDHMEFLGDTREKIAVEKAGVFRASKLAICGDENPPISLINYAEEIDADFHLINRDFKVKKMKNSWQCSLGSQVFSLNNLSLQGDFQLNNAACAICAVHHLNGALPVNMANVANVLSKVELVGRFQKINEKPLVVVDVAHNPQAAKSLAENLKENTCAGRTLGVFAMLADKDIQGVIKQVMPHISDWYLASMNNVRGATASALQKQLRMQAGQEAVALFDDVASALKAACIEVDNNDRIIVFGSFYTVAGAIEALNVQRI